MKRLLLFTLSLFLACSSSDSNSDMGSSDTGSGEFSGIDGTYDISSVIVVTKVDLDNNGQFSDDLMDELDCLYYTIKIDGNTFQTIQFAPWELVEGDGETTPYVWDCGTYFGTPGEARGIIVNKTEDSFQIFRDTFNKVGNTLVVDNKSADVQKWERVVYTKRD